MQDSKGGTLTGQKREHGATVRMVTTWCIFIERWECCTDV